MKTVSIVMLGTLITVWNVSASNAQIPNPPGIKLDHYACYRVSPVRPFNPKRVKLADQFGNSVAVVMREAFLCAPVEKNNEPIKDKEAHLVCYTVTGGRNAAKTVAVINQFGTANLRVGGTVQLCVPSLKKVL